MVGLAGIEWAVQRVETCQRGVLEVLGEERVSLSVRVRHVAVNAEMLLGAEGKT